MFVRAVCLSLSLTVLTACQPPAAPNPDAGTVAVADALCRPAAPGRDVTGCYAVLTASAADRLVSVSSPEARGVQIHEMKTENGMMRMAKLPDGLPLPSGEPAALAPGGEHLMVFGATTPLTEGGTLNLTLTFKHAPARTVAFQIAQPPATTHGGH